jgi:DnaJ-class molecular chaperone
MALRITEIIDGRKVETLSDGSKQVICRKCDGAGDVNPQHAGGGFFLSSQCGACKGTGQDIKATKALETPDMSLLTPVETRRLS